MDFFGREKKDAIQGENHKNKKMKCFGFSKERRKKRKGWTLS
jgi:hypothetical protein